MTDTIYNYFKGKFDGKEGVSDDRIALCKRFMQAERRAFELLDELRILGKETGTGLPTYDRLATVRVHNLPDEEKEEATIRVKKFAEHEEMICSHALNLIHALKEKKNYGGPRF